MRQNFITLSIFLGLVALTGCRNSSSETSTNPKTETTATNRPETENLNPIIDLKSVNGKTLSEVEKVLGKAESMEKVKGYPCRNTNCQRAFFKKGNIEIIFKHKKRTG